MYNPTIWEDHTTDMPGVVVIKPYNEALDQYTIEDAGNVMTEGVNQDQNHFQQMENGILDASIVAALALNYARQNAWEIETGTVTLTNSLAFPFNNSKKTVALATRRESTSYVVLTEVTDFTGNVGDIEITDKLTNGFKLAHTGSAASVTVKYTVIGGFMK